MEIIIKTSDNFQNNRAVTVEIPGGGVPASRVLNILLNTTDNLLRSELNMTLEEFVKENDIFRTDKEGYKAKKREEIQEKNDKISDAIKSVLDTLAKVAEENKNED